MIDVLHGWMGLDGTEVMDSMAVNGQGKGCTYIDGLMVTGIKCTTTPLSTPSSKTDITWARSACLLSHLEDQVPPH